MRERNGVVRSKAAAPIERLQLAAFIDAERIGRIAPVQAEDLWGLCHA